MTRARLTVGALTALAVAASGMALAAPAEAYGPASSALKCRLYFSDAGTGIAGSTYTDSFSLTASPAAPAPGATVTVTLSGAAGPINGPVQINPNQMVARAVIDLSGAATGTVSLASPTYPGAVVAPYTPMGAWSATGTYVAAAGTTSLALKQLKLDDSSPANADTYCADVPADADVRTSGGAVSTTIVQSVVTPPAWVTGVRANGTTPVPAAATPGVRAGDAIDVDGDTSWTPSGALYATVCTADNTTTCAPPAVIGGVFGANGTDPAPAVDGAGELTPGTLKLLAIQTPGPAYLQLWQGTINPGGFSRIVTKYQNIPVRLLGARTITATPETIVQGDDVTVTGTGWYPGEDVTVVPGGFAVADAAGEFVTSEAVNDVGAVSVDALGVGGGASDSVTVTPIELVLTGSYALSPLTVWISQSAKVTPSAIGAAVASVSVNWGDGSAPQSVSTTLATSHAYTKAGSFAVKATFAHANGLTTVKNLGTVLSKKDTVKPTAALILPAKAKRPLVASWKTLRGTAADTGLGPKSVLVSLTQKRGTAFYYYTGRGWAKAASSKVAALKAAKVGAAVAANKTWALGVKGLVKGTLTITYRAVDKAGNVGAAKAYAQVLVR